MIRHATPGDIDGIMEVWKSSFPYDAVASYIIQYSNEFPKDFEKYSRLRFELFFRPEYDDWEVMVAEAPSSQRVVAYAIWNVSYKNKRVYGPGYRPQNRQQRHIETLITVKRLTACSFDVGGSIRWFDSQRL